MVAVLPVRSFVPKANTVAIAGDAEEFRLRVEVAVPFAFFATMVTAN